MFKHYARQVLSHITARECVRKRIYDDVLQLLADKSASLQSNDPYILVGDPKLFAKAISDQLSTYSTELEPQAISWYERWLLRYSGNAHPHFEWLSRRTLFGIPLVHINLRPFGVSRGIVSVGSVAIGLLSFGGIGIGLVGLGGISLGIVSLGGMAFGWLGALGGIAVGWHVAIGGMALARHIAIGALAVAHAIAIGDEAKTISQTTLQENLAQLPAWLYKAFGVFLRK